MSSLSNGPQAIGLDLYDSSTTQMHRLGERVETADGRVFRYARAGLSALVAGNVIQAAAQVTTHKACAGTTAAIGATSATITLGATNAVTANQYAGGYAVVTLTPGNGYAYLIDSHPAAAASATCLLTLADPLKVAWTTSTDVSLTKNPYDGVIQSPITTLTGAVVGVAVVPAAASEYCWIQTHGVAATLTAGTPGVGLAVVVPGTAAGCVVIDGAASATQVVGSMMETGVDATNCAVLLSIN